MFVIALCMFVIAKRVAPFNKQNGNDEDDFLLSGLTQNTFLPNRIFLDGELSILQVF